MSFERWFEQLKVRVEGESVVIEQPDSNGDPGVYVPVHQIPLLISWLQEAKAEIEALATSVRTA